GFYGIDSKFGDTISPISEGRKKMRSIVLALFAIVSIPSVYGQSPTWMPYLTQQQTYPLHRSSSRQSTGGNADYRTVTPGDTATILDVDGPGMITHMWFT